MKVPSILSNSIAIVFAFILVIVVVATTSSSSVNAHDALDLSSWNHLTLEQALARTESDKKIHQEAFDQFTRDYHSTEENFQKSEHFAQVSRIRGHKMSCSECEMMIGLLEEIAKSPSSINSTIDLIDAEVCTKLKNATSKEIAICKDLVSLTLKTILPMLFKGATSLAWNVPQVMCADIVKACSTPCCANAPTVPQQLFLSFANSSNWYSSLAVTWVTQVETPGAQVRYGAIGGTFPASAGNEVLPTRTYTFGGWIGRIHYAQMTGLQPSTSYWYQVGSDQYGWSTNYTFTTMSQHVGQKNVQPLKMLAIADMGWGPASNGTLTGMLHTIKSQNITALLFPGDVGYSDGYEAAFDLFMNKFEPVFAQVPIMFSAGNHDCVVMNCTAFKHRLAYSQPPAGFGAPADATYHRQQIGTVHFVNMDSESAYDTADIDKTQVEWATTVMDTFPKTTQLPWLITAFHRPLYCNEHGIQCNLFTDILRMQVEGLLNDKKVDAVFNGHVHTNSVSWPIAAGGRVTQQNYKEPSAPVYFIVGNAGNREPNEGPGSAPWVNCGYKTIGFTVLEFASVGEQHELTVSGIDSATGQQLEQIVIQKTL